MTGRGVVATPLCMHERVPLPLHRVVRHATLSSFLARSDRLWARPDQPRHRTEVAPHHAPLVSCNACGEDWRAEDRSLVGLWWTWDSHEVVVEGVGEHEFQKYFDKKSDQRVSLTPVASQGISSFMMSAGIGALSRSATRHLNNDTFMEHERSSVDISFDDFLEVKKLGEGTFGKVMLVRHKATGHGSPCTLPLYSCNLKPGGIFPSGWCTSFFL